MTIGGLWHGASINFVLWGLFHGILLIINDLFIKILFAKNIKNNLCIFIYFIFMDNLQS